MEYSEALSVQDRVKLLEIEWGKHKFRPGEYFDRYLYKLLRQYDLSLSEYYKFTKAETAQ